LLLTWWRRRSVGSVHPALCPLLQQHWGEHNPTVSQSTLG
jgi:hypothetical protein